MLLDSYVNTGTPTQTAIQGLGVGQTFQLAQRSSLTSVKFKLSKVGSPSGDVVAQIYAHQGVFGSSGKPLGSSLITSDPIAASTLPTFPTAALVEFIFPFAFVMTALEYVLIAYHVYAAGNYVNIHADNTSPTHAGNGSFYNTFTSTWEAETRDYDFELHGSINSSITGIQSITGISSIQF